MKRRLIVPNGQRLGCVFIGALLIQLVPSSTVEAQESQVLQCDVAAMTVTTAGETKGPTSQHSFTIEFLSYAGKWVMTV